MLEHYSQILRDQENLVCPLSWREKKGTLSIRYSALLDTVLASGQKFNIGGATPLFEGFHS